MCWIKLPFWTWILTDQACKSIKKKIYMYDWPKTWTGCIQLLIQNSPTRMTSNKWIEELLMLNWIYCHPRTACNISPTASVQESMILQRNETKELTTENMSTSIWCPMEAYFPCFVRMGECVPKGRWKMKADYIITEVYDELCIFKHLKWSLDDQQWEHGYKPDAWTIGKVFGLMICFWSGNHYEW